MNNLYTFKGKILLLSFATLAFCFALTDAFKLFATRQDQYKAEKNEQDLAPVVVLNDGKGKKIMAIEDFFKMTSSNPNLNPDEISKVAKLKDEHEWRKAKLDFFKTLTGKKEESFLKRGHDNFISLIKAAAKPLLAGAVTVVEICGVVVVVLWYLGWFKGEDKGKPTDDFTRDYTYTDPLINKTISYEDQLCADHGLFYNTLLRPGDCPPLN